MNIGKLSAAVLLLSMAVTGQGRRSIPNAKPEQTATIANTRFTEPEPMNFDDHRGYVSLFDGLSLKGWDGNPKFWRVENGAIVGESTRDNPSGNTYIAYRGVVAKDFTLKFEIKIEGAGGSACSIAARPVCHGFARFPPMSRRTSGL